jgi:hypothetical protein
MAPSQIQNGEIGPARKQQCKQVHVDSPIFDSNMTRRLTTIIDVIDACVGSQENVDNLSLVVEHA